MIRSRFSLWLMCCVLGSGVLLPGIAAGVTVGVTEGDLNRDGMLDDVDIDLLAAAIRESDPDNLFDLDGSGRVDLLDYDKLVTEMIGTGFGDLNLDGQVDFTDFLTLQNHFNRPGNWAEGDTDGDGVVSFRDYMRLQNNFGLSFFLIDDHSGGGFNTSITSNPEPISGVLGLLGMIAAGSMATRRRRPRNPHKPSVS